MKIEIVMASAVFAAGLGMAQMQPQQPVQVQPQQPQQSEANARRAEIGSEIEALEKRAREVIGELDRIETEAKELNPAIEQKRGKLLTAYREKLEEYGFPSDKEMERLQVIQKKLQIPANLSEDEKVKLQQEFQIGVQKMQDAKGKAQADSDIVELQDDYYSERINTMKKIDAEAESMEDELENIQSQLAQLRQELQQIVQQQYQQ